MKSEDTDIKNAIDCQKDRLKAKVKLLDNFNPTSDYPFKFTLAKPENTQEPDWSEFAAKLSSFKQFVYVIRTEETDAEALYGMFNKFKKKEKDAFRLSSTNEKIRKKKFKQVIYVGTSSRGMGSFKDRLREHLGIIGPKVYSLQLAHWLQPCPAKIHVEVFPIEDSKKGILYDFENALWDFYEPLFGKKGVNVSSSVGI